MTRSPEVSTVLDFKLHQLPRLIQVHFGFGGLTCISPPGNKVLFNPSLSRSVPGLVHTMQCSAMFAEAQELKTEIHRPGCLG